MINFFSTWIVCSYEHLLAKCKDLPASLLLSTSSFQFGKSGNYAIISILGLQWPKLATMSSGWFIRHAFLEIFQCLHFRQRAPSEVFFCSFPILTWKCPSVLIALSYWTFVVMNLLIWRNTVCWAEGMYIIIGLVSDHWFKYWCYGKTFLKHYYSAFHDQFSTRKLKKFHNTNMASKSQEVRHGTM